jgi:hypothetical protein
MHPVANLRFAAALAIPTLLAFASGACGARVDVPGNTGGAGGALTTSSSSGSPGTGGTGNNGACVSLGEIDCMSAHMACAPVYDDHCCPTCDPVGGCADCVDIRFHHCSPIADVCVTAPTCGIVPMWGCTGNMPDCNIPPGGSSTPCHTVPGCTAAYCGTGTNCGPDPVCHPINEDICYFACDPPPPLSCPPGTSPEGSASCYTGYCISSDICGF